jgi:hypothetical protein
MSKSVDICGLVVSVIATVPKIHGFKPDDSGLLMAIKIHSTTSFGREVKPSVPCRKIWWHVKSPFEVWKI